MLIRGRLAVGEEPFHLDRRGRKSGNVEEQAPSQLLLRRFRGRVHAFLLELDQKERIDRIPDPGVACIRRGGAANWLKGPMIAFARHGGGRF